TVYRRTPALWRLDIRPEGFRWVTGDAAEDNVLAFLRLDADGAPLLAVSNFAPVVRSEYRLGVPDDVPAWHEVLNTDAARYGGSGLGHPDPVKPEPQGRHGHPASVRLVLPPPATVWLRPAGPGAGVSGQGLGQRPRQRLGVQDAEPLGGPGERHVQVAGAVPAGLDHQHRVELQPLGLARVEQDDVVRQVRLGARGDPVEARRQRAVQVPGRTPGGRTEPGGAKPG